MGRRPDSPEDQAAKGYPGKRKSRVDRMIAEAERRAEMLASQPSEGNDPLAPPAFINDPALADALWIWRRFTPQLAKLQLFSDTDRLTFAMYCVYQAEFFEADRDIRLNGYETLVRTVSGDKMPRLRFAVHRRDTAGKRALELSGKFGLTPLDLTALQRIHSAMPDGALFQRQAAEPTPPEAERPQQEPAASEEDPIGLLDRFDSAPPTRAH